MTSNISASNCASMQALSDLSATQPIVFCQLQPIVFCQCGCNQLWEEDGAVKMLQSHLFLIINLQAYSNPAKACQMLHWQVPDFEGS